jgi:hypothetical protein
VKRSTIEALRHNHLFINFKPFGFRTPLYGCRWRSEKTFSNYLFGKYQKNSNYLFGFYQILKIYLLGFYLYANFTNTKAMIYDVLPKINRCTPF